MERTVLVNQRAAVDTYNFTTGESLGQSPGCCFIVGRLCVGGIKHCLVHHQVVGVSGPQAFALAVVNSISHGQRNELVRFAFARAETFELFLHSWCAKLRSVRRQYRCSEHIQSCCSAKACQSVDVRIRVIARQIAVVEPKEMVDAQTLGKQGFDVGLIELRIAVRVQQAFRSGEQGAFAVRFDAATFEFESRQLTYLPCKRSRSRPLIWLSSAASNLPPQPLKRKSSNSVTRVRNHGKESMVARPGIVGGTPYI